MPTLPKCNLIAAATVVAGMFSSMSVAADTVARAPADTRLRVMSFNSRYATAPDGENAWDKRIEIFFATIRRFGPDLIGFQEVLHNQYDDIVGRMTEYSFYGVGPEDGAKKGQMSLIGYRKDRFSSIASGTFWLSETPDVIRSKSWDSAQTRICSWVRLHDQTTNRELVYANTHFDHRGVVARREASRVLSERLAPIAAGGPSVLTGDFNSQEDSPAYQALVKPEKPGFIRWIDAYRHVYPARKENEATFHGFKGTVQGSRIDFIFCTPHFKPTAASIDRSSWDGRYPSDHYPITAVFAPTDRPVP